MSVDYSIRHVTRFTYPAPVSESVMEVRMRPTTHAAQRCLHFELEVQPQASVFAYRDSLGNWVHYFDLPLRHGQLAITARAQVQIAESDPLPAAVPLDSWQAVDRSVAQGEHWDFLQPSHFVVWSDPLVKLASALGFLERRDLDPLTTVREIMAAVHRSFEYAPNSTRVDSPIGDVLAARRGVCQDFVHVMLALLRRLHVPCRYVSGYIAPASIADEGAGPMPLATHAWVEVLVPGLGWVGVDPTNNIEAGVRHVRVAIGRDYADVPPTRGVFKGDATSTLEVSVDITSVDASALSVAGNERSSWLVTRAPAADVQGEAQRQQQQ